MRHQDGAAAPGRQGVPARFRDEAKVVVKLSHGNLVPVFDAGQVAGEIFLAMDFVEGKDLRAVWNRCAKKGVAFPVDVAVYIVKELPRARTTRTPSATSSWSTATSRRRTSCCRTPAR